MAYQYNAAYRGTFVRYPAALDVDVRELLLSTKKQA
ncbi:hypothetical protein ABIE50_003847 [Chitinophaga sp. OAE865]